MKYKILWDYRSEGHSFHTDNEGKTKEFETVDEAVKEAIACNYSAPFLIVSVVDWKAIL